jgi:succinate dehydrogenase / fumarate reductase iron-sulfur subunit
MTKVRVRRQDPDMREGKPYVQAYEVDTSKGKTVLDVLREIRNFQDPTLGFRCSCNSAICGSCGMRINGQARLACNTQAQAMVEEFGELLVEPLGNLRPMRDLVVDMGPFWQSVMAVKPFLQHRGKEPAGLYPVTKAQMDLTKIARDCIFCGSCLSDCTSREANPHYLGPAALAKAFKFAGDARDDTTRERLVNYSMPNGIWDCDTCLYCNEVCPMGVKPMDAILRMREMAVEQGLVDTQGAKHAIAFYDTVMTYGRVNEAVTAVNSLGLRLGSLGNLRIIAGGVPTGKHPKVIKEKLKGMEDVKKLRVLVEQGRRKRRSHG